MKNGRLIFLSFVFLQMACTEKKDTLSEKEKEQIKNEVIDSYKKHIEDLKRLDYNSLMSYFVNDGNEALFVDGKYWGGYKKIDAIWKDFCEKVDTIIYWNLSNHHVYPLSKDAASYLVEFDNLRIEKDGDTIMGPGSFSLGMQKINGSWKIATADATHNYTMAPWLSNASGK